MADAVAVDAWEGHGVRLGQVAAAMADLRHRSAGRSAARTAVMTLAVVAGSREAEAAANDAIRVLGSQHPARVVMLRPDPDGVASLDARAVLYNVGDGGHPLAFEEVTLVVGGQAALHLDSLVETFTLADLPVVAWYVDRQPEPFDSLLNVAGAVLLDSRELGEPQGFRRLMEVSRRRAVVDLSWVRLQPVRELLAGLFDPPALRPFVTAVISATVRGKPGPRHLLAGWLMAKLRLSSAQVHLEDARHVEITLRAELEGEVGTFDVGRLDGDGRPGQPAQAGERALWAGATVPTGPSPRQVLPLPDASLPAVLAVALTRLAGDATWEQALSAASALAV